MPEHGAGTGTAMQPNRGVPRGDRDVHADTLAAHDDAAVTSSMTSSGHVPGHTVERALTALSRLPTDAGLDAVVRAVLGVAEAPLLPAVIDQLPIGVVVARPDGEVLLCNDRIGAIWHVPGGTDVDPGTLWSGLRLDGRPYRPGEWPLHRTLHDGEPVHDEQIEIERFDGSQATISVSAAPVRDGEGMVVAGVMTVADVTERREAEQLREAFVGVLSHELRTPITSVFGGTQLLRREGLPESVRATVLEDVVTEAERLHRLVEDLLVMARIERGVTFAARDPVLLQRLIPRVLKAERRRWPRQRFNIRIDRDLPAVEGEDGYLEQVLRNLVSNAAKYGPSDGNVEVEAVRVGDEVHTRVLDEGPGIPDEEGDRIFRLFYRSPTVAGEVAGAGIGLYVARAIVEAMGGRVWARSRPDTGADVGFALRCHPVERED
jgi:signal transduction histidine kinase